MAARWLRSLAIVRDEEIGRWASAGWSVANGRLFTQDALAGAAGCGSAMAFGVAARIRPRLLPAGHPVAAGFNNGVAQNS